MASPAPRPTIAPTSEDFYVYEVNGLKEPVGAGATNARIDAPISGGESTAFASGSATLSKGDFFTTNIGNISQDEFRYVGAANSLPGGGSGFIAIDTATGKAYLFATSTQTSANITIDRTEPTTLCYMAGTAITTPEGAAAVETLKIGDIVTLSDGSVAPVTWIGRNTVSTVFADKLRVLPIRIKAGALADNMPARDLLISPEHAILLDGVLVQAGTLVNGVSILRETAVPEIFTYYHVEVANHALILAENVAAETFVDNVDRMAFDNWAEHEALYGTQAAIPEMAHPRAKSARQVPAATRARLEARGEALYGVELAQAS